MQAIRKRIKPENGSVSITIPENMRGTELDIIILPVEEREETIEPTDPVKYRGALKIDLSNDDIIKNINRGRDEWEGRIS